MDFFSPDLKYYTLGAVLCGIGWILYAIYDDFTLNNDPDGRRLRSHNRRLRRRQKLLQRRRHEQILEQKVKAGSTSTSSSHPSSCSSVTDEFGDVQGSSVGTDTEDGPKSTEGESELNAQDSSSSSRNGIWSTLITKVSDFFSDKVAVPESGTDEEIGASSFVLIPKPGFASVCVSSSSYRKCRMNTVRHGHSWDPNM